MSKTITVDGNQACAKIAYYMSEVACIYPITPSSPMAENCDQWQQEGKTNLFGNKVKITELQSEGGASGSLHGSLSAGALTTTFTASQGLLLMLPNMYKIAGEMLPCVIHVAARTVATHALSIFCDHSDVMATRQSGFAMLASSNVQECLDLALVAHLASLESSIPFTHFFDGFRTSHEIQKIYDIDENDIAKIVNFDAINHFRQRAMTPDSPICKGTTQNPDSYFQNIEARNIFYEKLPKIVSDCMHKVATITSRQYHVVDYFGAKDATKIIVIMGSGADTVHETVAYLNKKGEKVGLIKIRLYRPFPAQDFVNAIPKTCECITVLDRTKEFGATGEPLYQDVLTALNENNMQIKVLCGRYGLSSKEFTPSMVKAVFDNASTSCKNHFTVGIDDDVSNKSLAVKEYIDPTPEDCICCKFYGLGSDGTVGANKNSIKIIGNNTDKYAQAYFAYDSKKSGGLTISHLRFANTPIQSAYLIEKANFLACHNPSYVHIYDMVTSIKDNGKFLLNIQLKGQELFDYLPNKLKKYIAEHNIDFYVIDAFSLARKLGLGGRVNTIMQACFFYLANIIPYEDAKKYMMDYTAKTFSKKGEKVVKMNCDAITHAIENLVKIAIPDDWKCLKEDDIALPSGNEYFDKFCKPVLTDNGNSLKVSSYSPDGVVPTSTTQYEKRGASTIVAKWKIENCIQCNQCSLVCPHACIRPILIDQNNNNAPSSFETKPANAIKGQLFRVQISPLDCTGCGSCINVCPAPNKALEYADLIEQEKLQKENWDFAKSYENSTEFVNKKSIKGSQFARPLFEFSGACAGCGETPYIKLATQLFGDNMIIANATGCSSIYGGSCPTCPYSKNNQGKGPAWANSLFEDNAEFGYGISIGYKNRRNNLKKTVQKLLENGYENQYLANWLQTFSNKTSNKIACEQLIQNLENMIATCNDEQNKLLLKEISKNKDALQRRSIWIIGGDGWAYDIGYGGLDHVLASGEDVNILVLDTEVYSNTGGQSSKSTPIGAVAKFNEDGKKTDKKDLGLMAINYNNVYVANVALGADMNQCLKAFNEAEEYDGVSLIVAYSPCISHGINMSNTILEEKRAVQYGYWNLFRFNPTLEQNKFILDSKQPQGDYSEFLKGENRYASLARTNPDAFEELLAENHKKAIFRYNKYLKLQEVYKDLK